MRGEDMKEANEREKGAQGMADPGRRRFGAGLVGALGGGLLMAAGKAEAFPAGAGGDFNAATNVLKRYGVGVGGAFDATLGHDVLTVTALPQLGTQYDLVVAEPDSQGGILPCWRTSSFDGTTTSIHYAPGEIIPCIRVTVAGPLMTYDLLDPSDGDILPCVRVTAEHTADGGLGPIVATVEPDEDFKIVVGTHTYRLTDGQLIEEVTPH
jgi:hypothetical protein